MISALNNKIGQQVSIYHFFDKAKKTALENTIQYFF